MDAQKDYLIEDEQKQFLAGTPKVDTNMPRLTG